MRFQFLLNSFVEGVNIKSIKHDFRNNWFIQKVGSQIDLKCIKRVDISLHKNKIKALLA